MILLSIRRHIENRRAFSLMDTFVTGLILLSGQNTVHTAAGNTAADMRAGQAGMIDTAVFRHIHHTLTVRSRLTVPMLHISAEYPLHGLRLSGKRILSHKRYPDLETIAGADFYRGVLLTLRGDRQTDTRSAAPDTDLIHGRLLIDGMEHCLQAGLLQQPIGQSSDSFGEGSTAGLTG